MLLFPTKLKQFRNFPGRSTTAQLKTKPQIQPNQTSLFDRKTPDIFIGLSFVILDHINFMADRIELYFRSGNIHYPSYKQPANHKKIALQA